MRLKTAPSLLVLGILILASASPALAVNAEIDSFSGKSFGELAAAWSQWQFSIPASENPRFAQGAIDCSRNQSGPIWFLAAATTGTETFVRSCTVPHSKALFFPVLNSTWVNEPGENVTVAEKRDILDGVLSDVRPGVLNSRACQLEVTIDGQISTFLSIPTVRVQSPPFLGELGPDPIFGTPNSVDPEAITDGFWVLLPPLSQGQHVLRIQGAFCEFDSTEVHPFIGGVDVTYNLNVN